jgi:hypothetical protein
VHLLSYLEDNDNDPNSMWFHNQIAGGQGLMTPDNRNENVSQSKAEEERRLREKKEAEQKRKAEEDKKRREEEERRRREDTDYQQKLYLQCKVYFLF